MIEIKVIVKDIGKSSVANVGCTMHDDGRTTQAEMGIACMISAVVAQLMEKYFACINHNGRLSRTEEIARSDDILSQSGISVTIDKDKFDQFEEDLGF